MTPLPLAISGNSLPFTTVLLAAVGAATLLHSALAMAKAKAPSYPVRFIGFIVPSAGSGSSSNFNQTASHALQEHATRDYQFGCRTH